MAAICPPTISRVYTLNMYGFIFKFFGLAILLLIAFYSAANAFRNARKLDARIEEYQREQEEKRSRGITPDPYSELAEIYTQRNKSDKGKR